MPASLVAETGHAMPLTGHSVIVGSDPQAHVPVRADLGLAARHYELRSLPDGRHEVVALVPMAVAPSSAALLATATPGCCRHCCCTAACWVAATCCCAAAAAEAAAAAFTLSA